MKRFVEFEMVSSSYGDSMGPVHVDPEKVAAITRADMSMVMMFLDGGVHVLVKGTLLEVRDKLQDAEL